MNPFEDNQAKWISAGEALARADESLGNRDLAKRALELCLREGRFHTKARALATQVNIGPWITSVPKRVDALTISLTAPPSPGLICLFPSYWLLSSESEFFAAWDASAFGFCPPLQAFRYSPRLGTRTIEPTHRSVAYGLTFKEPELEAVLIEPAFRRTRRPTQRRPVDPERLARKRLTEWEWDRTLSPLMSSAESGKLDEQFGPFEKRGAQARLEREIGRLFSLLHPDGESPDTSTLRRKARQLIDCNNARRREPY